MMTVPNNCDVVVIGGGPGGSTVATILAQKGYDVVVFDREKHPRYHVGENLIPHAWKYTDITGASAKILEEGFTRKAGGTVVWNGVIRQMSFQDFGYSKPALHVERDRYDFILLDHARSQGVRVFEMVTVLNANLPVGDEPVQVVYRLPDTGGTGTISCRVVVDASGQSAVLGRQLDVRLIDDGFRFMSIWGYFDGSRYVSSEGRIRPFEDLTTVPPNTFVSSLDGLGDWGWVWHIPLRETTSVGLVVPQREIRTFKGTSAMEDYFLSMCRRTPYIDYLLSDAIYRKGSLRVIRDYSYRSSKLAGQGYYLLGDAAGFVDPIFSVGVVLAMYSGYVASWAIDRSIRNPTATARLQSIYTRQVEARLELARSLALPRYSSLDVATEAAKSAARFESSTEHELMCVVSAMTTRSENARDLLGDEIGRSLETDRYQTLDEIVRS